MEEENRKDNTRKNNSTTWGNKPEGSSERWKTKEISTKGKTIQTKLDIPKQRKKILSTIGRTWHKNIPTTRRQRNRIILDENMATDKHNEKAEWINDMTKELEGFEEGPKAEIHIELLKKTHKKRYQTGKRPEMMEYMDFGSRNSPPFTTD